MYVAWLKKQLGNTDLNITVGGDSWSVIKTQTHSKICK